LRLGKILFDVTKTPIKDQERNFMTSASVIASEISKEKWYYSLELSPGVVTQGRDHVNIVPVRMALAATEIQGKNCLDIGTQDGFVPILLARRSANYIAAQDIVDRSEKISLVKKALGIDFDYFGGTALENLRSTIKSRGQFPFDVTIFSGVLYHMIDPFAGLTLARSFVRTGGVLIVETVTAIHDSMVMHFNAGGKYIGDTGSYFVLSTACLDYMLRLLRLEPIDCLFTQPNIQAGLPMSRICVVCRAVGTPVQGPNDAWIPNRRHFDALINWEELNQDRAPVSYAPINDRRILHPETGTVDVHQTVLKSPPVKLDRPDLVRLGIDDMY
jgi:2-polyprenyl-3-methyl-5-hydroxy-6-metoxy-1,4-benzoquinol methylase